MIEFLRAAEKRADELIGQGQSNLEDWLEANGWSNYEGLGESVAVHIEAYENDGRSDYLVCISTCFTWHLFLVERQIDVLLIMNHFAPLVALGVVAP